MPKTDYLPTTEPELIQWSTDYFGYLVPHAATWNVDSTKVSEVNATFDLFLNDYQLYHQPEHHTPMNRQAKDNSKHAYVKDVRTFNQAYLIHNQLLSDADRVALGLHVPKSGATSSPDPTTYPEIKRFVALGAAWIDMHYQDVNSGTSKARPFGVREAEIRWGLYAPGASLPVTAEELPNTDISNRTPFRFKLPGSTRSMMLCAVMRWVNTRGVKGPWAPNISSTVVD